MKNSIKKLLSIMLMTGIIIASTAVLIPPAKAFAAASITTSATPTSQSATPGSVASFPVVVTNTDTTNSASLTIEASSFNSWTVALVGVSNPVAVGANSSITVVVQVTVPSTATAGQYDVATLTVKDAAAGDAFVTSISLTVNVQAAGAESNRPLLSINNYSWGDKSPKAGNEFQLTFVIENRGLLSAYNYQVSFSGEGFYPRGSNGTDYIHNIEPGAKYTTTQNFLVGNDMAWTDVGSITATVNYTDAGGKAYTATYPVSIQLSPYTGPAATATPKNTIRPQLVITANQTDIDPLQPGSIFELTLDVKNLGTSNAKNVVMILGGGATVTNDLGTPQPGSSGGNADLTNFAPLGSSNIVVVGDVVQGSSVSIKQKLVVNVSTVPGAYTLKTSFSYVDEKGTRYVDDQVITLLVYSLPQVEVSFYRDPGMLMAGMPNQLPLQVTNLGKKSSVLGNMNVTSTSGQITNGVSLVGALDPGGYFTLDTEFMPMQEGSAEIDITINYTDDFNQPRQITQKLTVEVMPEPVMTPDPMLTDPEMQVPEDQSSGTFWSKVARFFKGLFGLDSGEQQQVIPLEGGGEFPVEESVPVVVPKG